MNILRSRYFRPFYLVLSLLVFVTMVSAKKGKSPPKWLTLASERSIPEELKEKEATVIILHDEGHYEVDPDGTVTLTSRYAIRIRKGEGTDHAVASLLYHEDTDKPVSIKAWMIPPARKKDAKVIEYKQKDVGDAVVAGAAGSYITTSRRRFIDASGDAMVGSVFGYETVSKDQGNGSVFGWSFKMEHPALWSKITLTIPETWEYRERLVGSVDVRSFKNGASTVWDATNIPGTKKQPFGVADRSSLAITLIAPNGERDTPSFTWEELARYFWPYYNSDRELTSKMESKVAEVTSGMSEPFEYARALAELSQSVNYLSIELELGSGGGYRPRSPEDVFTSNYGDCKDKTNFLVALLESKGLEAYPLIVNWGEGALHIDPDWVSPMQFNHCITAIKVPDDFESPNVVRKEGVGNLFIFDPTNEHTVFGDIGTKLQGTHGLLLAGDAGGLITIPKLPLETCEVRRTVSAEFGLGGVVGDLSEVSHGQNAKKERRFAFTNDKNYDQRVTRWLADTIPSAQVSEIEPIDDRERDTFSLSASFMAKGYGKNLRNRTLIFKPVLVGRLESLPFGEEERTQAVQLNPECLVESYDLTLPEGFEVSELPEDQLIEEDFGSYELKFEYNAKTHRLDVNREIRIRAKRVPLEEFATLESFFKRRIKADKSTVVLEAL